MCDENLARALFGSEARLWPQISKQLEREGLPPARRLFGGLRYVPAVLEFLDRREGGVERFAYETEDGPERFEP